MLKAIGKFLAGHLRTMRNLSEVNLGKEELVILGIETSCDETAAAVVRNGREVLSNVIYSQIDLHTLYGGVVPEIASRKHIEKINQVIEHIRKGTVESVYYDVDQARLINRA